MCDSHDDHFSLTLDIEDAIRKAIDETPANPERWRDERIRVGPLGHTHDRTTYRVKKFGGTTGLVIPSGSCLKLVAGSVVEPKLLHPEIIK
jgi:hypothetical protein